MLWNVVAYVNFLDASAFRRTFQTAVVEIPRLSDHPSS
jgi:hypothetical protein